MRPGRAHSLCTARRWKRTTISRRNSRASAALEFLPSTLLFSDIPTFRAPSRSSGRLTERLPLEPLNSASRLPDFAAEAEPSEEIPGESGLGRAAPRPRPARCLCPLRQREARDSLLPRPLRHRPRAGAHPAGRACRRCWRCGWRTDVRTASLRCVRRFASTSPPPRFAIHSRYVIWKNQADFLATIPAQLPPRAAR